MKFRFNRQEAAEQLSAISSVASARTPKDILKCVRIEAKPDVLLFSATDLEIGLRCATTQVEVEKPGETVVVAETLAKIVRECTDEILTAETDGNVFHLRGSGSHFQIVTQEASEFPPVPIMEGEADLRIAHPTLQRLIELTSFAVARESTRYAINGVLWEVEDGKLSLAATDGRRLALAQRTLEDAAGVDPVSAIVPGRALSLFTHLPAEPDVQVGVKVSANQMLINVGRAVMSTALVEGQFPKYHDVIPSDCDRVATMKTEGFLSALRRAALLTNEESKGVRFSFSEGTLTLSSRAPEQGEATVSFPIQYTAEPLEIGFNPVFLLDLLRVARCDEITFAVKEANRPGVIQAGDEFLYVVMPVNLSSA